MVGPLLEDMIVQEGGLDQLSGLVHGQGLSQFVCHEAMILRIPDWSSQSIRLRNNVIG